MILRRRGSKARLVPKILPLFPEHRIYIEPFFGAGGMFFNKPKAKYNVVNDLDEEVFNLFMIVKEQSEKLCELLKIAPIHTALFDYYKTNIPVDNVERAARFLYLSNYSYLGKLDTLRLGASDNSKTILLQNILKFMDFINDVKFSNKDYKSFLEAIPLRDAEFREVLIYSDPPYVGTEQKTYNAPKWTIKDFEKLVETHLHFSKKGCKIAISEFNLPEIVSISENAGFTIIDLGERQNLKDRRNEILIVNYKNKQLKIFDL